MVQVFDAEVFQDLIRIQGQQIIQEPLLLCHPFEAQVGHREGIYLERSLGQIERVILIFTRRLREGTFKSREKLSPKIVCTEVIEHCGWLNHQEDLSCFRELILKVIQLEKGLQ